MLRRFLTYGAIATAGWLLFSGPAFSATDTSTMTVDRYYAELGIPEPIATWARIADLLDNQRPVRLQPSRSGTPYFYAVIMWHGGKPAFHMLA